MNTKVSLSDIIKDGEWKPVVIDWEQRKLDLKKLQDEWDLRKSVEEERIKLLSCPVCKDNIKEHVVKYESNSVMGPGYHSHVIDDYYVCKTCGVHFNDLHKVRLGNRPYNIFRY